MKNILLFEKYLIKQFRDDLISKLKDISNTENNFINYDIYVKEVSIFLISRQYTFLGEGRNRKAFLSKDNKTVIKIPTSDNGSHDNLHEYNIYIKSLKKDTDLMDIYPRVKILDVIYPLLFMEKLETDFEHKNMPWWVGFIDLQQVGYDSKGVLRAYDFGIS